MSDSPLQKFEVAFDRLHDALGETWFMSTPEGRMIRWNDTLRCVTGYSDEEISTMHLTDLVPVEDRPCLEAYMATIRRKGRAALETRYLTRNGQTRPYLIKAALQKINDEPLICGRGEPLTDRADSFPENQQLSEHIRQTLRELPVFLYTMDRDLRYTWVSSTLQGMSVSDFIGRTHQEIFPPIDAARLGEIRRQVLETGETKRMEFTTELQGETHVIDTFMAPRYDKAGRIIGLVGASVDVTDRRETENQFRRLVEEVEEYAIFMLDREGRITTWNEGARKIKGYEKEEVIGKHFSIFYPEVARAQGLPEELLEKAAREGYVEREGWRVRKNGTRFWARITITALHDNHGRLRGYSKVTRDMTQERRQQQELRESEQRYRRLFEEAQEAILTAAPDGQILEANPAGAQLFGYTREELLQMNVAELYADSSERSKVAARVEEQDGIKNLELQMRRKDGGKITCQITGTVLRNSKGQIRAFQAFVRDITEQKHARQALRESEKKFRALAEQSTVGIFLMQENRLQYVNRALAEMYGYDREQLLGRNYVDLLVHPEDQTKVQRAVDRRLKAVHEPLTFQFRGITRSGQTIYVQAYGTGIEYQGRPTIIGTDIDITERRRLQQKVLKIQEDERRRIGQELHDGIASHLTGLDMIFSAIIRDVEAGGAADADELRQVQEMIRNAAEQTRKLSHGLNPVTIERGGLCQALEELAALTQRRGPASCQYDGPEHTREDLSGEVTTHVYRMAQEAASNAAKHSQAENIRIQLAVTGDELVLSVEDDGIGLPEEHQSNGGIGFQTMRYRTDLLGGTMTVTEPPGGGTKLMFHIPI